MKFQDKVVIITGASQNTGVAIARKFLNEGAKILISSNMVEDLEIVYQSFVKEFPNRVYQHAVDISNNNDVEALFSYLDQNLGRVDILVNNACNQGIGPVFDEIEPDFFKNVLDVNLFGTFLMSHSAVLRMLKQDSKGVIVNMGSNVSDRAIHNRAAYITTKAGIDGFTKAMAVDLGPKGIRINTVAPGYINTNRWDVLSEEIKLRRRANIPLGKEAYGDDIADAVLFLASTEASVINGTRLVVDGGCAAQHLPLDVDF